MIYKNTYRYRYITVNVFLFLILILLVYFYSYSVYEHRSHVTQRIIGSNLLNNVTTSSTNFNFVIDQGYWNFSLNSFIKLKLEADITPDINSFIQNNIEFLKKIYKFQIPIVEQTKHYGSMSAVGINIKISSNETLILIFSRIWYSKIVCSSACNPDRSYIYAEVLTSNYKQTSFNMTLKNKKIIKFPGILNITDVEVDECCLGPEDPRIILDENNRLLFTFNMIDKDKRRKIWLYDMFENYQISFSIRNKQDSVVEKNWTPFFKDNKLYFIYSHNPLKILHCSTKKNLCEFIWQPKNISHIGSLRGGTQFVRFRNSDYFVGISRTTTFCSKCQRFYRPHLVILSTIKGKFHVVYVSEPLMLDSIPIFASYFLTKSKISKDFCDNIIRIMTPGSIIDWQWPDDKLIFTISINDMRSYIISIVGIGNVVQNIISAIKTNYSQVFFNSNLDMKIVSHSETMAINYCESISQINKMIAL